jgi:dolichyl-phosphate beta-glucosyltransferase
MDLSIVIPAYNEAPKIAHDITQAAQFLENHSLTGQIIVVDDGSKDDTAQIAQSMTTDSQIPVSISRLAQNQGKGAAVRTGICQTEGQYVMFSDSGCCIPYEESLRGLDMIKKGECNIAHASRKMPGTHIHRKQSLYRRLCSKIFHWFVVHDFKSLTTLTDTQCGFKIYKGDIARELYANCFTDGFMFDVEIIIRALKAGYRIKEFPVDWTCDRDSRLSPLRTSWHVITELIRIKRTIAKE